MIKRIIIISDMEFDEGVRSKKSTYEVFKEKYEKSGYSLPKVVFWNVQARQIHCRLSKPT